MSSRNDGNSFQSPINSLVGQQKYSDCRGKRSLELAGYKEAEQSPKLGISLNKSSVSALSVKENTSTLKKNIDYQTNRIPADLKTDQKTSTTMESASLRLAKKNNQSSVRMNHPSLSTKSSLSTTGIKIDESKSRYPKRSLSTEEISEAKKYPKNFSKEGALDSKVKQPRISNTKKERNEKQSKINCSFLKEEKSKHLNNSLPKQLSNSEKAKIAQKYTKPLFPITESIFVDDMVALRQTSADLVIPGQPSIGKVVSISKDGTCIVVHMYVGSIRETVWPMMCRESPYTREFTKAQVIHRFHMNEEGNALLQKDIDLLMKF